MTQTSSHEAPLVRSEWIFADFHIATMMDSSTPLTAAAFRPHGVPAAPVGVSAGEPQGGVYHEANREPYGAIHDAIMGVTAGRVDWVLPRSQIDPTQLEAQLNDARRAGQLIEGEGHWLTPGLIDCHTHLVYGGNRAEEWEARLSGTSYEDIARAGGGILSSVRATRQATEAELVASALRRLMALVSEGVTTVEIKSGYGLDLESELKMLRAANEVGRQSGIDVQATLLAAHAVPPEFQERPDDYIDHVCRDIIPAAQGSCVAVDAFCESIAFSVSQTKRVLQAGLDAGLQIKVHAEQLSHLGMAVEAARMGAISADHLEYLTTDDCAALAETSIVATLLPGAFYCLRETQVPPVQALLNHGIPIAIATDSNPGSSPVLSPLMIGNMACLLFGMTPEQSLAGLTRNAARALALEDLGVIRPGAVADFAQFDVRTPGEIFYSIGGQRCVGVFKRGLRYSTNATSGRMPRIPDAR